MENKLKIGDKVKIKNNLKGDKSYGGLYFDFGMEKFNGETHEIVELNGNGNYRLDIDVTERHYWVWNDAMVELVAEGFTKANLKTGMVVEHKDGDRFMVIGDHLVSDDCCHKLSEYKYDLTPVVSYLPYAEIVAVYNIKADELDDISDVFADVCLDTIWRREEIKEMTVAEIEEKLGYKVKIVDGE